MALSARARPGLRRAERSSRAHGFLIGGESLDPAHQHIEQSLARRLFRHVAGTAGEHRAVDVLNVAGDDGERGAEFGAQLGELQAGPAGDFSQPDFFEGVLGE